MIELIGRKGSVKIFTDEVEDAAMSQIAKMLNSPITQDAKLRIMPDVHYGKGATIGTSIQLPEDRSEWRVSPNVVGVDIGCGMMSYKLESFDMPLEEFDEIVNAVVPAGSNVHSEAVMQATVEHLLEESTLDIERDSEQYLARSLGTLGGGNHFIELAQDEEGTYWLTVHSGSRKLGAMTAKHHQNIADASVKTDVRKEIIAELKRQGRETEIESTLAALKPDRKETDKELNYLTGEALEDYLTDMDIAQKFASNNRRTMLDNIVRASGLNVVDSFDSVHNFIDIENGIIRKGATSAQSGERLIIPLNMRDGSLICRGKGNSDWNYSAPHGAGRIMSRRQAKESVDYSDFKKTMEGVYSTSVVESTLDESPFAYKPVEAIVDNIGDTVEIEHRIKPVYNFKAK